MNVLLPLLIVAIAPDAPIENRYPEAVSVFHCNFDQSWDENFDGWPDHWTRRKGRGFPSYVAIKINEQPSPQGDRCLKIELDGGAAVAYSPPVKVDSLFGYVVEGYVKTEDLDHDRAYLSLTLMDGQRNRLQTFYSQKIRQSQGWKKIRLGPVSPESGDARQAVIGLHLQPQSQADLDGSASFDDVWLGRVPRLALSTTDAYNFFDRAEEVEVNCIASGFPGESPPVTFQLEDVLGRELARLDKPLGTSPADAGAKILPARFSPQPQATSGKTSWKPPVPGPGFYRVRATIRGRKGLVLRQQLGLAVVDSHRVPLRGEFGWTLPQGDQPLPLPVLNRLICQAGINWVKYPLWRDKRRGEETIEHLISFAERLSQQGIEMVGLLCDPPLGNWDDPPPGGRPASKKAADLFAPDPKVWYPSLKPVITRLATRVRWWQLGHDKDTSFVDHPNLSGKIAQVKAELDRIGQDVNLGLGWSWVNELPQGTQAKTPWRFLALSADPPMTHRELATCLDASQESQLQRWVVIEPLSKDRYPLEVRATDLARRMIAAKIHGAEAVFCPQPFSTQRGLLNDDGTPGELFFTWRTAARTLGGAKHLGSLQLPRGSSNFVFARGHDVVMVVWNDKPTEEVIYLGEDVRQIDLWGRSVSAAGSGGRGPEKKEHRQVIRVGRLPTFITGIHGPITRWRLDFALAEDRIPSISNHAHQNSFQLKNHFPRGVVGRAALVTPDVWKVTPPQTNFWLADSEQFTQGFQITLPHNASSGPHSIRTDFEVQAERSYRFSVYRRLEVGMGDVYIEIVTRLSAFGELEVDQRIVNRSDAPVSFRCQLFAPHRRRLRSQVIGLKPGRDQKLYRLPDGKQLIGQTLWLRADEIGGPRILNYRFQAEP